MGRRVQGADSVRRHERVLLRQGKVHIQAGANEIALAPGKGVLMKIKRILATSAAVAVGIVGMTASATTAAPPKCPPGQTAVVTVVGTDLVTTCRVL